MFSRRKQVVVGIKSTIPGFCSATLLSICSELRRVNAIGSWQPLILSHGHFQHSSPFTKIKKAVISEMHFVVTVNVETLTVQPPPSDVMSHITSTGLLRGWIVYTPLLLLFFLCIWEQLIVRFPAAKIGVRKAYVPYQGSKIKRDCKKPPVVRSAFTLQQSLTSQTVRDAG